jgi:protoporphyrinogen oxidase
MLVTFRKTGEKVIWINFDSILEQPDFIYHTIKIQNNIYDYAGNILMTQDEYKKALKEGTGELNFDRILIYTKDMDDLSFEELMFYGKTDNTYDDYFQRYLENNFGYSIDIISLIARFGSFEDLLPNFENINFRDIDSVAKYYQLIGISHEEYEENREKIALYGRIMMSYHAVLPDNHKVYFLKDQYILIKNSI